MIESISGSLMDNEINNNKEKAEKLIANGLIVPNLAISYDFDFVNQIERGLEMNANISVNKLIQKIYDLSHPQYKDLLIQVLPKILEQEQIKIILPFLTRTTSEFENHSYGDSTQKCNLE
jgi:hypothetical protein